MDALSGASLRVPRGAFLAVMGPSGPGKSTMLNCACGLDRPTSGTVEIGGTDIGALKEPALIRFRRVRGGFVFQSRREPPRWRSRRLWWASVTSAGRGPEVRRGCCPPRRRRSPSSPG
ncbi:hypothetical protein GCM10023405_38560 [Streptomonospora salina]